MDTPGTASPSNGMYAPDYLAGITTLPPSNGADTDAEFFASAPTASSTGVTPAGAAAAAALTNTPAQNTGVLSSIGSAASSSLVQAAQYTGIALLAVILIAIGLYVLISPSATQVAAIAGA